MRKTSFHYEGRDEKEKDQEEERERESWKDGGM